MCERPPAGRFALQSMLRPIGLALRGLSPFVRGTLKSDDPAAGQLPSAQSAAEKANGRCNSVHLTRPFRNAPKRCPFQNWGWKALPVAGSCFRQRRPAIGFDRPAPASYRRTKLLDPVRRICRYSRSRELQRPGRKLLPPIFLSNSVFLFSTRIFSAVKNRSR